jgi:hypothetical protein
MTTDNLMAQLKLLQEMAHKRIREKRMREATHLTLLAQLMRFGVCPCTAMGRYSTCCGSTTDGGAGVPSDCSMTDIRNSPPANTGGRRTVRDG